MCVCATSNFTSPLTGYTCDISFPTPPPSLLSCDPIQQLEVGRGEGTKDEKQISLANQRNENEREGKKRGRGGGGKEGGKEILIYICRYRKNKSCKEAPKVKRGIFVLKRETEKKKKEKKNGIEILKDDNNC